MPSFDDTEFNLDGAFKPPVKTDDSLFPFGTHKGTKMSDVPAEYLDWAYTQPWLHKTYPAVAAYIKESWQAIQQELRKAREIKAAIRATSEDEDEEWLEEKWERQVNDPRYQAIFDSIDPLDVPY